MRLNRCVALFCLIFILCGSSQPLTGQTKAEPGFSRAGMRHSTGVELLGNSLLYSFYYQYMMSRATGAEVGLAFYGSGDSDDSFFLAFVPVGLKLYPVAKNGSPFLALGGVLLTSSTDIGPFDDDASTLYGYIGPGFEYRSEGGFTFRFAAYGLLFEGGFLVWPGLTLGYSW